MIKTIRNLGLAILQGDTGKVGFRSNIDLPLDSEISWYQDKQESPAFVRKTLGIPFITGAVWTLKRFHDPNEPAFFRRRNIVAKKLGYKLNSGETA